MNLVADEGVDRAVVEGLRAEGHDVLYVAELSPCASDEDVLRQASARSAVLITADRDFGELVFRQRTLHSGIVLLRVPGLSNAAKAALVSAVVRRYGAELSGSFSVVSPGQVRIRRESR